MTFKQISTSRFQSTAKQFSNLRALGNIFQVTLHNIIFIAHNSR